MNLDLDFTVCMTDNCKQARFCDTTCEFDYMKPANCVDGYGYLDNPNKIDIAYTRFNWVFPDASYVTDSDINWKPGTKASNEFQITAGTTGVIVVDVNSVVIGDVIFTVDIETTVGLLVTSINNNTSLTGWKARVKYNTTNTIVISNESYGVEYNGLDVTISVTDDIAVTQTTPTTVNGTDETDCVCVTMNDLSNATTTFDECTEYADGVHAVTYILFDSQDQEIARETKRFLFTCNLINGIKELILTLDKGNCPCSKDKFDKRIYELRVMLEQAQIEFDNCLFDCANETIQRACKLYELICTGC